MFGAGCLRCAAVKRYLSSYSDTQSATLRVLTVLYYFLGAHNALIARPVPVCDMQSEWVASKPQLLGLRSH